MQLNKSIEWEETFLNLFGYRVTGPDSGDRWIVQDEKGNIVGFIQLKVNPNFEKGLELGYYMELESENIKMKNFRIGAENELVNKSPSLLGYYLEYNTYKFDVKTENGLDHVELSLGKNKFGVSIVSDDYEKKDKTKQDYTCMKFELDESKLTESGLDIIYVTQDQKNKIRYELVGKYNKIRNRSDNYYVVSSQVDKNDSLMESTRTNEYLINLDGAYCGDPFNGNIQIPRSENMVFIEERWKKNNEDKISKEETVEKGITLDEKVLATPIFIDTFTGFRTMLSQLLPIKGEFFSSILKNRGIHNPMLDLFLNDMTKETKPKVFGKDRFERKGSKK